tara:strand:- start:22 stop:387 length:366 start_codon:yes stop_codon:yes gene_type:complete
MFLKNIPLALLILSGFIYSSEVNAHPGSKRFCYDMVEGISKDDPVPYWIGEANSGGGRKNEQIRCMHTSPERHRGKKGKRQDVACHKHFVRTDEGDANSSGENFWTDGFRQGNGYKCRKTG